MTFRRMLIAAVLVTALATLAFHQMQQRISARWIDFALDPDVQEALHASAEDQRRLRQLDPGNASVYRERFDTIRRLLARFEVLELNRTEIGRRQELMLLVLVGGIIAATSLLFVWRARRDERRLGGLRGHLEALSAGEIDIAIGDPRRDAIGRMARMIEATSRMVARDRRRLRSLEHLSSWQEAARRQAHEIRTPLTAARLELERLAAVVQRDDLQLWSSVGPLHSSVMEELDRLGRFTREFTSFATIGAPQPERAEAKELVQQFANTFGRAWPNLSFRCSFPEEPAPLFVDREMIRRVLVNLASNSAQAISPDDGRITLTVRREADQIIIEHRDDGPGIDPAILPRLFEPYATTRRPGEGMGLGLAISRKILLDHGGDLELASTSAEGSVFRLILPIDRSARPA